MKRNIKITSFAMSLVAIVILVTMLIGSTFAWFTDEVSSNGNIIKSGKLDVEMYWANGKEDPTSADWKDASTGAIFDYDKWEPGYVEVRHIKIENAGTLAFKYKVNFIANGEVSELSDVIDVYYADPATQVADRTDLSDANKIGTLTDVLASMEETASGELIAGEAHTVTLALKMQEKSGNKYQDKSIGTDFSIQLLATQLSSESDGFGNDYDADSKYKTPVSTLDAFFSAIDNGDDILLADELVVNEDMVSYMQEHYQASTFALGDETEIIDSNVSINGNGIMVYRSETLSDKPIFSVAEGYTLVLENITIDGGAVWTGAVNSVLGRGTENNGITTTGALVSMGAKSTLILGEGAVLQNNCGANAVNLGTRVGAKLFVNGGEIVNNYSAAGAIWGGGEITLNSGKINNNHGGIGGAIRVVTNIGTVLTMNGGEMNHNLSDDNGGAIWAGSSKSNNVYVLNGGEMAYNYSYTTGGAIYAGYYETVKIGGTFKMHDNDCVEKVGAAIRFYDHASFVMTGGEIYNNGDDGNSLFLNNNSTSITGGKIVDNFGYSGGLGLTWGNAEVDGVITYNLSTNHNTAYLAKEFGTLNFRVNESANNFVNFNFKPSAEYVYTEGDEAKLVCLNEGYETYWDATTETFRLKASN